MFSQSLGKYRLYCEDAGTLGSFFSVSGENFRDDSYKVKRVESDLTPNVYNKTIKTLSDIPAYEIVQKDGRYYLTLSYQNKTELMQIKIDDGRVNIDGKWYLAVPDMSDNNWNAISTIVNATAISLAEDFYKQNADKEKYAFDTYGGLKSFTHVFQDGTILDYNDGISEYIYPNGSRLNLKEKLDSNYYESISGNMSLSPTFYSKSKSKMLDLIVATFSNGIKFDPNEKYRYCWVTDQNDEKMVVRILSPGTPVEYGDYTLQFDKYVVAGNETDYKIVYKDGSSFYGQIEVSTVPVGKTPPANASPEYLYWIRYCQEEFILPAYAAAPYSGFFYDKRGQLYRVQDNPKLWYDANSDGTVTEVYENGKPMARGFARDKKISEYNGALAQRAAQLKEYEEKEKARQKEREAEEKALKALYAKYGQSVVDKLLRGNIPIGVSLQAIRDVYCSWIVMDIDHGSMKHYNVGYDGEIGIWTENGKVTSVIYWKR